MATVLSRAPLSDFFLRLADDPELLAEYEHDPRAVLEREGLGDDEIELVLTGPPEAVRAAVERELAADPLRRRVLTTPKMVVHTTPDQPGEPKPKPEPKPEPKPRPKPRRSA